MNSNPSFKELHEENLLFPPSDLFKQQANISSLELYEQAKKNPETFWESQAKNLEWIQPWNKPLEWNPPYAKWFVEGKINACYNCIDRHLNTEMRNKKALIWESESGKHCTLTYLDLYYKVCQFSNVLKSLGIKKGDVVAIYLPMIPEAILAMLACARIGAIHTVIFAGFSADSIKDRILDSEAKLIITADGGFRRGKILQLKNIVDLAIQKCPSIENVLVIKHTNDPIEMHPHRDHFYDELIQDVSLECAPEVMDAEDILFILYTSGTTGKPKGIIHTTGGYLVGVNATTKWVFDIKSSDTYWCTADIGWITGHSYVVYGPLSNGMTQFLYEGTPDFPERDCFWKLIEKYKINTLYTAPTAIRTFMKWGEKWLENYDLSSLRLLGTVGEPINPEAWMWYYTKIGKEKCPIVDTWWQTETGSIMIAPIPGIIPLKPGSATLALPGIQATILNNEGSPTSSGYLAITHPWPSMLRGLYKDPKRYEETYWKKWNNTYYFTGDGAKLDQEGCFWLMGRVDDVINVSGHRLGTMEIESALVDYNKVAEAAVIAVQDPLKGQAIVAFVTLKENFTDHIHLEETLKEHVVKKIGAIAKPKRIIFTHDLPKTRSGKIMRRLLRDIGEGKVLGDISTLTDITIVDELKLKYEKE